MIPDETVAFPGHLEEIAQRVNELEELIHSIITGRTERHGVLVNASKRFF